MVIQCVVVSLLLRGLHTLEEKHLIGSSIISASGLLIVVLLVLFAGNLLQATLWSGMFFACGEFENFGTAFYHSLVNFSTLGYGDLVMSTEWRLLGALEAANGVLMLGLTTSVLYSTISALMRRGRRKIKNKQAKKRMEDNGMRKMVCFLLLALASAVFSQPSLAEKADDKKDIPWERFQVSFGGYFALLDSNIRVGSSALGIDLDVEEFLGLDSSQWAFRLGAVYRFGKSRRHAVGVDWFKFDRSGDKQVTTEIILPPVLGGGTIPVGLNIQSVFNFDIYEARYRYSFIMDDRMEANVGVGLFVMPIEFGIGQQGSNFTQTDITAPLPVLGLGFNFAITPKWLLRQNVDLMYLEYDDFKGGIFNYQLALEWRPLKHWGFGAAVETMNMKVEVIKETSWPGLDFDGAVKFGFQGLRLYVKYLI